MKSRVTSIILLLTCNVTSKLRDTLSSLNCIHFKLIVCRRILTHWPHITDKNLLRYRLIRINMLTYDVRADKLTRLRALWTAHVVSYFSLIGGTHCYVYAPHPRIAFKKLPRKSNDRVQLGGKHRTPLLGNQPKTASGVQDLAVN